MTIFWIYLVALLLGSMLVFYPLLLRRRPNGYGDSGTANLFVLRDQLLELDAELAAGTLSRDQYGIARGELERRVLEEAAAADKLRTPARSLGLALGLILALPIFCVTLYLYLGNRDGIAWQEFVAAEQRDTAPPDAKQIEDMVTRLAQGLQKKPGDADGWLMLARSYGAMGRFSEASAAYARAAALLPQDAQVLADYADALAMAQGRNAEGEPARLIQRALAIDPDNLKALALAGSAAFARRDFDAATLYWQKAARSAPPQSDFARSMQDNLGEARRLAQNGVALLPAQSADKTLAYDPAAGVAPGLVAGRVIVGSALAAKVASTDTVFVFARAGQGPRMPLAILRRSAGELPLQFTLDDTMAMAPEMKLSNYREVVVGARVSKSGSAMPQSGDLQGQSETLKVGTRGIEIVIDQVVP